MQNNMKLFQRKNMVTAYIFLTPALLSVAVFFLYSAYYIIQMSFFKTRGFAVMGFNGFSNFSQVLRDPSFWQSVRNTLYIGVLSLVTTLPVSLALAIFINEITRGRNFFKSIFFIPNLTSIVAASMIFLYILAPTEEGLANTILGFFGIEPLLWFSSIQLAPIGIVIIGVWKTAGYNAIIWLTGLLAIPTELYEAAEIDGANKLKQWIYITIPQLKPVFIFLFMTSSITAIRRFGDVWIIGGDYGAPAGRLSTMVLYSYRQFVGDGLGNFGIAASSTVLMFLLIMGITIINLKVLNKEK